MHAPRPIEPAVALPANCTTPPSMPPVITHVFVERATLARPLFNVSSRPWSRISGPSPPVAPVTHTRSCGGSRFHVS